jgi:diguanylate cyclase (GGDEF)-like protein/PAS domain S-box-containing protein
MNSTRTRVRESTMRRDSPPSILLIEDDADAAASIEQALGRLGYVVTTARSSDGDTLRGDDGLCPDLILSTTSAKGAGEGIEAARLLSERLRVPIVSLLKPFTERELAISVESALTRHALERELEATRAELATKTALLEGVLESIDDAILARDRDGGVLLCNEAGRAEQLASLALTASAHVLDSQGDALRAGELPMVRAIKGEAFKSNEVMLVTRGGKRWLSINATPLRNGQGKVFGSVAVSRDITAAKALQDRLERLSLTDELTGLYNRRGFMTLAEQQFRLAARGGKPLLLLFADVNGLKTVNDALGHEIGDALLLDAAQVLQTAFRSSDIVARLGGDEFVVLLIDPSSTSADLVKTRLEACIAHFNNATRRPYRLSLSVGVCASSADAEHGPELQRMLAEADAEMYLAKQERRKAGSGSLPAVLPDEQFSSGIWSSARPVAGETREGRSAK